MPAPLTEGDLLDITGLANSVSSTYTLSAGVRVDMDLPSGTYIYTYNLIAVANPIVYNIIYYKNTTETVTSMPNPNPQIVSIDGGTPTAQSYATLSNSIPVLADKVFGGWCDTTTTFDSNTENQVCSGTIYQAGGQYGIDQTVSDANITLYAIWLSDPFPVVWS